MVITAAVLSFGVSLAQTTATNAGATLTTQNDPLFQSPSDQPPPPYGDASATLTDVYGPGTNTGKLGYTTNAYPQNGAFRLAHNPTNHIAPMTLVPPITNAKYVRTNASFAMHRPTFEGAFKAARDNMVASQLKGSGRSITHSEVINAMDTVPRENFVPALQLADTYADKGIRIGSG